jgi:hypothetical protein
LPKKSKPDYFKDDSFKFHSLIINNCIGTMSSLTLILEIQILEALESLLFSAMTACRISIKGAEKEIVK